MSGRVSWMLELAIRPGRSDDVRTLMQEMVEATQASEPGTLNYEWFFDPEETTCHIWERYSDSAAAMTHLGHFGEKFAERFLAVLEPTRLSVYGNPTDDVREALRAFGPAHMSPVAGFTR